MRTLCLIAAMMLAACSTSPAPKTETYLLRSPLPQGGGAVEDSGFALAHVEVATYINQPGLVLTTGDGKVQAARNHVWAEPLQVSLRRYLAEQISAQSGMNIAASPSSATSTRINVSIDQLHGDAGAAVLVAYWDVATGKESKSHRFSQQQVLSSDGYDALVDAEQALLKRLADAIADSLPTKTAVESTQDGADQ